jgi:uncharacterized protein YbaP (TraB family)
MRVRSLLAPLALLLTVPACAQPAPQAKPAVQDADPALWVVKDKDTTIYLFGTIHVLKPGLTWFDEAVKKAFDSSDQVVLELVMPDTATMQSLVMSKGMAHDGVALTDRLPADKRPAYAAALKGLGLPANAFDQMQPWFAATNLELLPLMKLGYDPQNGPEQVITKAAAEEHKPVIGLETAEQQLGFFAALSTPAQVSFLDSTVDDLPKLPTEMNQMVDDWAAGKPERLAKLLNDDLETSPEVKQVLLIDRNKNWANWITERLKKPGTVFIAVGAGHLAGDDSVMAQLDKLHHIKAERVKY